MCFVVVDVDMLLFGLLFPLLLLLLVVLLPFPRLFVIEFARLFAGCVGIGLGCMLCGEDDEEEWLVKMDGFFFGWGKRDDGTEDGEGNIVVFVVVVALASCCKVDEVG